MRSFQRAYSCGLRLALSYVVGSHTHFLGLPLLVAHSAVGNEQYVQPSGQGAPPGAEANNVTGPPSQTDLQDEFVMFLDNFAAEENNYPYKEQLRLTRGSLAAVDVDTSTYFMRGPRQCICPISGRGFCPQARRGPFPTVKGVWRKRGGFGCECGLTHSSFSLSLSLSLKGILSSGTRSTRAQSSCTRR